MLMGFSEHMFKLMIVIEKVQFKGMKQNVQECQLSSCISWCSSKVGNKNLKLVSLIHCREVSTIIEITNKSV